jgi:putative phosphoesterase
VVDRNRTRVLVLADTHVRTNAERRTRPRWLAQDLEARLAKADVILHAGDVLDEGVLARLNEYAPVHAVLGNNDIGLTGFLPERLTLEIAGVPIGLVHDSGRAVGRAARLRRWFPDARLVVFGHSHAPVDEEGVDGQRLFNPGSPTQRRAQPVPTFGELILGHGRVLSHHVIPLRMPDRNELLKDRE